MPCAAAQAADATFADIGWLTETGGGLPVIVKGVLRPDDALACAAHGAAGVIVSNHGGRQLDQAPASLDVLPAIKAAVGDRMTVMLDSGIRRGADISSAIANFWRRSRRSKVVWKK